MRHKLITVIFICLLCSASTIAFAHPGSTDEYGGHVDYSTGEYHYHHGYPEHQHTNGICPYDFVDNADHSYNGYSSSTSANKNNYTDREQYLPEKQYPLKTPDKEISSSSDIDYSGFWFLFYLVLGYYIIYCIIKTFILKIQRKKLENQKNQIAKQQFQKEKNYYTNLYADKDISLIANVPKGVFFDSNNLPHKFSKNETDIYTVYISSSKTPKVYHRKPNCILKSKPVNYSLIYRTGLQPCKKCKPITEDLQWYENYVHIIGIKNKYHID